MLREAKRGFKYCHARVTHSAVRVTCRVARVPVLLLHLRCVQITTLSGDYLFQFYRSNVIRYNLIIIIK